MSQFLFADVTALVTDSEMKFGWPVFDFVRAYVFRGSANQFKKLELNTSNPGVEPCSVHGTSLDVGQVP